MFQFDLSQRSDLNTSLSEPERPKETEAAYSCMPIIYNAATAAHYLVSCHIYRNWHSQGRVHIAYMVLVQYWYTGTSIYIL